MRERERALKQGQQKVPGEMGAGRGGRTIEGGINAVDSWAGGHGGQAQEAVARGQCHPFISADAAA